MAKILGEVFGAGDQVAVGVYLLLADHRGSCRYRGGDSDLLK